MVWRMYAWLGDHDRKFGPSQGFVPAMFQIIGGFFMG